MSDQEKKPHAVCIPYPAQGHITPMLMLAKILCSHFDFHITFVNTEHNHRRLLHSRGPTALDGIPSFRFTTIPDGLPPSDVNKTQDIPSLSASVTKHCYKPLKELLIKLNEGCPKVSFIVSDCSMSFSSDVSNDLGIPVVFLWTSSACSFLCYAHFRRLIDQGVVPLNDSTSLTNEYLERRIDGIPSMEQISMKYLPSLVRTTNKDDTLLNILMHRVEKIFNSGAPIIFHTFESLECNVLQAISDTAPSPILAIGPLQLLVEHSEHNNISSIGSNLWQENSECLSWLDSKEPDSVVYLNFGSITVMNGKDLAEMAWGLANGKQFFLWIMRPDLVSSECAHLPPEFLENTKERGFFTSWCDQKAVLSHPSIGCFVTHCGWNSILESLSCGVPMICWPFFADQTTNSWFCCEKWGVGVEIKDDVRRGQVEHLVIEVMMHEKGKEMKERAMKWKMLAKEAAMHPNGSSFMKLKELICELLNTSSKYTL